jgi:hypothetical protein
VLFADIPEKSLRRDEIRSGIGGFKSDVIPGNIYVVISH